MAMSKAFDGFLIFTFIIFLAWFLLGIQLGLISFDSSYKKWHALLDGTGKFPVISTRTSAKSVTFHRENFFADNKLDVDLDDYPYNLTKLKTDLVRKRHIYKKIVVYADMCITIGGLIFWIIMVIALCCGKLERLFACCRGFFLILAGIFAFLCAVCSLVICVLSSLDDLDNYDKGLRKGLNTVYETLGPFYDLHPNLTNCTECDNNKNGKVQLSPHTWFLILLECLISQGKTVSDVTPKSMMEDNETRKAIEMAVEREHDSVPLVRIRGMPYSRWMLIQLQFCPVDTVKETIHGFLAVVLIFAPFVAYIMWKAYGSRKDDTKKKPNDEEGLEPILTEEPPEVVGSNKEIAEIQENPAETLESAEDPAETPEPDKEQNPNPAEEDSNPPMPIQEQNQPKPAEVGNKPKVAEQQNKPKLPESKKKSKG